MSVTQAQVCLVYCEHYSKDSGLQLTAHKPIHHLLSCQDTSFLRRPHNFNLINHLLLHEQGICQYSYRGCNHEYPLLVSRYVAKFRQWLDERGGGGPTPFDPNQPLPPLETCKEAVLDRWNTHTKNCKACQQVAVNSHRSSVSLQHFIRINIPHFQDLQISFGFCALLHCGKSSSCLFLALSLSTMPLPTSLSG